MSDHVQARLTQSTGRAGKTVGSQAEPGNQDAREPRKQEMR
jgi:hypothetical protein